MPANLITLRHFSISAATWAPNSAGVKIFGVVATSASRALIVGFISPALISGWLLAFTMSLDDLVVASFVSGPSATTLPMAVYSSVRIGVTPEVNAVSSLLLLVTVVLIVIAQRLQRAPVERGETS